MDQTPDDLSELFSNQPDGEKPLPVQRLLKTQDSLSTPEQAVVNSRSPVQGLVHRQ
jgi:hypothetical protein